MTRKEFITALDKMMKGAKKWEVTISREPMEDPDGPIGPMQRFMPGPVTDVYIQITDKPSKPKRRKSSPAKLD